MTAAYRGVVVFGQALLWLVLASTHAWLGDPGRERSDLGTGQFDDQPQVSD
jgi:hypothetical protein